jgi:hypothetical protein
MPMNRTVASDSCVALSRLLIDEFGVGPIMSRLMHDSSSANIVVT